MTIYQAHARGAASEYYAAAALAEAGWWVAKTGGQHCPFDLVAVQMNGTPKIALLDVKTMPKGARPRHLTAIQRTLGVKIIYVDLDTGGVSISAAIAQTGDHSNPLKRKS